jgi:hypothetical protein
VSDTATDSEVRGTTWNVEQVSDTATDSEVRGTTWNVEQVSDTATDSEVRGTTWNVEQVSDTATDSEVRGTTWNVEQVSDTATDSEVRGTTWNDEQVSDTATDSEVRGTTWNVEHVSDTATDSEVRGTTWNVEQVSDTTTFSARRRVRQKLFFVSLRMRRWPMVTSLQPSIAAGAASDGRTPSFSHRDTTEKGQSTRHIPFPVYLKSQQRLDCGRHGGACLLLLSAVSLRFGQACKQQAGRNGPVANADARLF